MLVTITQYARIKGISRVQVYRHINSGKIKAYEYKGRQLIDLTNEPNLPTI